MIHGLAGREPGLVVVAQQLVQEVQSLGGDQQLVLTVDETLPPLTGVPEDQRQKEKSEVKLENCKM